MKTFFRHLSFTVITLFGIYSINVANAQNTLPQELQNSDLNYLVVMGGKCKKLIINNQDITELCRDVSWQMSVKDRLVFVAMIGNNNEDETQLSFSGRQFQQPRLNRATLFLDYSRYYERGEVLGESSIVGTCEIYGDPTKEVTKHICIAQDRDGGEMIFEFSSYPNQIELIN
ncbi:hypothetical protein NON20_25670 (plasmid) [Synechocystis sp. B12]|nr:hypothetical protein NON20_25670 [Synechocystis sp. B12]